MKDNLPLLGQQGRIFFNAIAQALLHTDYRLYQQAWNDWWSEQAKKRSVKPTEKRAKRITDTVSNLRRPA